jgi:hypothetical protein
MILKLKVHVEAFYFCVIIPNSTYGIHPPDFTDKYPHVLFIPHPMSKHMNIVSMVLGMTGQEMIACWFYFPHQV